MADVLTSEQRQLNMSRIRGKDTKPEMVIRRGLHSQGLRYRLHDPVLPGRPDLVFTKHRAVIFVHGCFWHNHGCALSTLPKTRTDFWQKKFAENAGRDRTSIQRLVTDGWRVMVIWECALRGPHRWVAEEVLNCAVNFIKGSEAGVRIVEARGSSALQTLKS